MSHSLPPGEAAEAAELPSVAICTAGRDLPALRRAVESVYRNTPGPVSVIVVSQGDHDAIASALVGMPVRQLRDSGFGASRARNLALEESVSEIVVFTDDDCEVVGTMALDLIRMMIEYDIAACFGSVMSDDPVNSEGFVPTYVPRRQATMRGRSGKLLDGGIGACMALRRSAVQGVGGFDERFGPGTKPLSNCEDGELTYRLLRAGYTIGHCPSAVVHHYGRRPWISARRYGFETFKAIAAAYSMYAWRGDVAAAAVVAHQFLLAALSSLRSLAHLGRPGLTRHAGLLAGCFAGIWITPRGGVTSATLSGRATQKVGPHVS